LNLHVTVSALCIRCSRRLCTGKHGSVITGMLLFVLILLSMCLNLMQSFGLPDKSHIDYWFMLILMMHWYNN